MLVPGCSNRSSAGAKVPSRVVQGLFYCGTGFLCIFPFHAIPNPIAEVNHKTCRTVSTLKCTAVSCHPGQQLPRGDPVSTTLPSAGHLPTAIQMANRTQVPGLSCTISRMLTNILKIGRSGRKGT